MTTSILILCGTPEVVQRLASRLGPGRKLEWAPGVVEGRLRLERGEHFAVIAGDFSDTRQALEFHAVIEARAPDAVPVHLAAVDDPTALLAALGAGRVFRHLGPCADDDELAHVLECAFEEHAARVERRELRSRLEFTTEVLERFNRSLDERLGRQAAALAQLSSFVESLVRAGSLQEIADAALLACRAAFPERAVRVELWTADKVLDRVRSDTPERVAGLRHVRPIETPDGHNGYLAIAGRDMAGAGLSREDRTVLAAVASTCAVAVHNESRRLERDEAQHATILALAKLAEQRDNETGKHLDRVSLYCRLVAERLMDLPEFAARIDERFVSQLERSAPLHDIGKVGIPDSILLKPGKLDAEQWKVMRTHTTIGAETLESVMGARHGQDFLAMSRDIAWCHHERWDGSGYPRGLAGEEIPLAARILTVADVYDALTSVRPYKDAWTHERALATMIEGAGTQFDPRLIEVFHSQGEAVDAIRERLADDVHDFRLAT